MKRRNVKQYTSSKKSQLGLTLVELFVALSIGLVLFAGVMSIFVGMRTTASQTSSYGELQENGRFAISLLVDDLRKQNFWGDYAGTFGGAHITPVPNAAPGNDCTGGGLNNASFPNGIGPFRTLWGQTVAAADPMGCFDDANIGSDVIQIKRVITNPVTAATAAADDNYFLVSSSNAGSIFWKGVAPVINNSRIWQYQHHVYYVRNENQGIDTVPVLMQGQLTNQMSFAPVVDGIEMIRFMYGVDTDIDVNSAGYGVVDAFIAADNMTDALWNNEGGTRIIAVKIYVLARGIRPDISYENTNTYQLGDLAVTVNDNFRRLLFSSTVTLYNSAVDFW